MTREEAQKEMQRWLNDAAWMLGEPGHPLCAKEGTETVEVVPAAALQAEVEKREEVEEEARDLGARLLVAAGKHREAESKLSSAEGDLANEQARVRLLRRRSGPRFVEEVEDELEERIAEREDRPDQILDAERTAFEAVLQLLRDKGTEQNMGDFSEPGEPANKSPITGHSGVPIEGDPGLLTAESQPELGDTLIAISHVPDGPDLDSVVIVSATFRSGRYWTSINVKLKDDPDVRWSLTPDRAAGRLRFLPTQQQLEQSTTGKEDCETCGGSREVPTGECSASMSGPTCKIALCPPCRHPETEPCPDCSSGKKRGEGE